MIITEDNFKDIALSFTEELFFELENSSFYSYEDEENISLQITKVQSKLNNGGYEQTINGHSLGVWFDYEFKCKTPRYFVKTSKFGIQGSWVYEPYYMELFNKENDGLDKFSLVLFYYIESLEDGYHKHKLSEYNNIEYLNHNFQITVNEFVIPYIANMFFID